LSRKLWLLNFVLIAAISAGAWRWRGQAQDFRLREQATLAKKTAIPPTPPAPPSAPAPAVAAASYLDIAQRMLWAKDRNSQVIVDPPKPPEPPKPLPPLPAVHGVMNLGDGPIVMMSDKPGARDRGVHPGEMIGEFKLVSVDSEELVLAFEKRLVKKRLQELIDRSQDSGPAGGSQGQGSTPGQPASVSGAAPPPPPPGKPEPGGKLAEGLSQCQPGDSSPAGTIANGMRKVVSQTPFGPACRWEAIK
jgi:hypothetical protein